MTDFATTVAVGGSIEFALLLSGAFAALFVYLFEIKAHRQAGSTPQPQPQLRHEPVTFLADNGN
jgi:hypothetical protein